MLSIFFQPHDQVLHCKITCLHLFQTGVEHPFLSILVSSFTGELSQVMHILLIISTIYARLCFYGTTAKTNVFQLLFVWDSNLTLTPRCKLSDTHRHLTHQLIKHLYACCSTINWKLKKQRMSLRDIHFTKDVYFFSVNGNRHFQFLAEISLRSF